VEEHVHALWVVVGQQRLHPHGEARLVDGEVTMRRNYALEQEELDAGYILTCQSLPVSDQITVDYDA